MTAETVDPNPRRCASLRREFGKVPLLLGGLYLVASELILIAFMLYPSESPHSPLWRINQEPIIIPLSPTIQPVPPSPSTITPPQPR
ncbi:hypothetical protein NS506_05434 [Nocardia seriolae]|uniref:Uncharacterized protein n=1 Tax=Nocardia seriolae TaxID=37332 RepID=A0ABC9Z1U0_9NOCA|nr:hypothetical protein NS506_05434 [Nocardia seriolae]GEM27216.1 hypothetical protein NS2_54550 [Nocardia seriolae NBRC 15557]BEK87935.1 hypothetical protein NSERKGN1266_38860 [Nocardia seriolae]BEK96581.1 hypothetical protein NSER024013_44870 [Nocardia seriolae]GAM49559.1 hypothetical protein NS07_v2contig00112-0009 [Nocardia seriolae]